MKQLTFQLTFLFLSRALKANSALVMMSVWKLDGIENWKWRKWMNDCSYLRNFAVIIFVKALEKEIWSLNNLEEVFFGQHPILASQLDHPSRLTWSHLRVLTLTFLKKNNILPLFHVTQKCQSSRREKCFPCHLCQAVNKCPK